MEKEIVFINEQKYQKIKEKMGKKNDFYTIEELQEMFLLSSCDDIT